MSKDSVLSLFGRQATAGEESGVKNSPSMKHGQVEQAVCELIRDIPRGTHLTAPEVYRRARDAGLAVSLSTVYRALNHLEAHGNVTAIGSDRGRRYEPSDAGVDHDHLICLKCGLTIEFVDDLIKGFGESVAKRKGYEHKSSRFDILGLCSECKSKDEDRHIENAIQSLQKSIEAAQQAIATCRQSVSLHESRRTARGQDVARTAVKQLEAALEQVTYALVQTRQEI